MHAFDYIDNPPRELKCWYIVEMPDGKWRSLFEVLLKDSVFASFAGLHGSVPDDVTPIPRETVIGFDGCYGCQHAVSRTACQ